MANGPEFTDRDIQLILKSLPDGVDQRRLSLLPAILREWASTDLLVPLSMPSTKTGKERIKRLNAVKDCAIKLSHALDAADRNDELFWIMREMILADGDRLTPTVRTNAENKIQEMRDFLTRLSFMSAESAKVWKKGRGQPRKLAASTVLMDIAAIYEWLTNERATREVDRDTKKDTGPFWKFAVAIWPLVFGNGQHGLSSTIKNWADAVKSKLSGTRSPLLANIAMRCPTWGIFPT